MADAKVKPAGSTAADNEGQGQGATDPSPDASPASIKPASDKTREMTLLQDAPATAPTSAGPPRPPNGGYGWVCVACVATINAHTWGLNSSYSVFLAHYLATDAFPGATPLEFAFVGSLSVGCTMLISPLATVCVRRLGTKPAMMLGVVVETASFICAGFATKIWHLFLTQGVLFGLGLGFLFVPTVGIVPQWFTTRRSLATGIAMCGSGFGGLVYSFVTGAIIQNLGLAWAFRVLGIVVFVVNTTCTILIRDRNKIIGSSQLAFEIGLFKRVEYVLLIGFGSFSMLGYFVLNYSLANYANTIGLGASQASLISAIFNLGQAIGRPIVGYFSDTTGRINMAAVASILSGLFSLAIWVNAHVYGALIPFSLLSGCVAGTFWAVVGPVTAEVVGLRHVPSALNIMWLAILTPCAFSEPIALEIVAHTGSYLGTQLWTGFMYIAAGLCLVLLRGWKIGELREIARIVDEDPQHVDPVKVEENEEIIARSRALGRKRMLFDCWKWEKV